MNCYRKKQLLEKLQVSESTMNRWVKGGQFPPPVRVNRILLWDQATVDQWLQNQQGGKP